MYITWFYLHTAFLNNQRRLICDKLTIMFFLASTVLPTAVSLQDTVHGLRILPARFHSSLCGEMFSNVRVNNYVGSVRSFVLQKL